MKTYRILIIISTFIVLISCQKEIGSKQELIDRHMELTSPNNDWGKISSLSATYSLKTIINGNVVSEEFKELSQKIPGLQKVVSRKNDTITTITLTNEEGRNLIKFNDGKFFGINSIPAEDIEFSPIFKLKENIEDYSFTDSIWQGEPSFFLKSESKKDTYIFNKETTYLVAYISESNYGKSITRFEKHKEANGFIQPFKKTISIQEAGYSQQYTFDKISYNEQFPDDHFQLKQEWQSLEKGSLAPSFNLPTVFDENKMLSNSVFEGKVTLLDFWATWCKPCIKEFPIIDTQFKKYKDKGFQVVSISIDRDIDSPKSYLEKNPFSWNTSLYSSGEFKSELAKDYQIVALPKPILIDREGKIIAMDDELRGEKLESVLKEIFAD